MDPTRLATKGPHGSWLEFKDFVPRIGTDPAIDWVTFVYVIVQYFWA